MNKINFIEKYNNDDNFRIMVKSWGIKIIQNNILIFNADGSLKTIVSEGAVKYLKHLC